MRKNVNFLKRMFFGLLLPLCGLWCVACSDMNELSDRFLDKEETLYTEKVDSAAANAGFKRIEIQVRVKSQRVDFVRVYFTRNAKADSSDIQIGNRSGMFSKIIEDMPAFEYLFSLVSFDKYGNRSLPYELSGKVVGDDFLNMLINRPLSSVSISGSNITVGWGGAPSYAMGSEITYTNTSNQTVKLIVLADETNTVITDFGSGRPKYATLFLPADGAIDTLRSDAANLFVINEQSILAANGITSTADEVLESVRKLVYPLHVSTFADLFYFPNLDSLDLTGYGLKNVIPTLLYDRNSMQTMSGGGSWQPFMRRVGKPADINITGAAILQDLLESGQLKWVRYIPGTMELDQLLEPYVASGVVKLVQDDDPIFPETVYIEPQFFVNGQVVDNSWSMNNYYSGDFLPRQAYSDIGKFDPNNEVVNGDPVNLHLEQLLQNDGKNIYKCVIRMPSASFAMNLPKEYMYDSQRYRYLKFKMFCGSKVETMTGFNNNYLQPWIRPMNYMWNFAGNSVYGQQNWDVNFSNDKITDTQIRTAWKEYTVDMSSNNWWANNNTSNRRNRCIVFNIGHEPGSSFVYDENNQVVLYVADIRFSKKL